MLWEPTLSESGIELSLCNFNDIDVITDIGTTWNIPFKNFAATQIIMNKDENNTNKDYNANIYK